MLGKLIKYEFKATSRILLPLYTLLIVFAFINKIFNEGFLINNYIGLGNLPTKISMLVYIVTMVATFVVTLFIIIQRYRTNLLSDEGYLMNTLPVKVSNNILSKLIVALVWTIVSGIMAFISIIILAYERGLLTNIIGSIKEFFYSFNYLYQKDDKLTFIIIILTMFVGAINIILMIYASISIGSLFQKKKILISFGAFILLTAIKNIISLIVQYSVMVKFESILNNVNSSSFKTMSIIMSISFVIMIVFSIVYFIISNYILSKKLNLE